MSRDKRYQALLNSKRWREVKRIVWQRAVGLCEDCKAEGFITPGVDCHHIKPVESAHSEEEMRLLAFNPNNIRLLCVAHHIKVHKEMRSQTKEYVGANRQRSQERWKESLVSRFTRQDADVKAQTDNPARPF